MAGSDMVVYFAGSRLGYYPSLRKDKGKQRYEKMGEKTTGSKKQAV
jgi:hypothetical protein